jgi:hypothetical protein
LRSPKTIKLKLTGEDQTYSESYTYYLTNLTDTIDQNSLKRIDFLEAISIPDLGSDQFSILRLSPVWNVGTVEVSLLGEVDKIVPISKDRIVSLNFQGQTVSVDIQVREHS